MDPARESFTFLSDDDRLVGDLYLPADGEAVAAVVTTGPLTSVKEQATGNYARALAERGFAALAFDHRTFGESDGVPRQFENPEGKARDVSAAVTALEADPRTSGLPAVAVGICAGGGYMARAVADDSTHRLVRGSGRLLLRRQLVRQFLTPRVPGGDRPRSRRGTTLARHGLRRDDPGGGA